MRDLLRELDTSKVRRWRDGEMTMWGRHGGATEGIFVMRMSPVGLEARIIASSGEGWDHVSVSFKHRTPTWEEMETVKRLFFKPHEIAMQLHVPTSDHISFHPNCLHIWRPLDVEIPRPPAWMVGPQTVVREPMTPKGELR